MDYDLIIRGGTIIDGTRLPRFRGDVGIKNGRIEKIGRIPETPRRRVRSTLRVRSWRPGFVDLHTHYDAQIHWDPYCTISGWHGVTSVVLGNCGFRLRAGEVQGSRARTADDDAAPSRFPTRAWSPACRGSGRRFPNGSTISNACPRA
jgi:N-acyl-D-aspartate/D-glutamate deacylase